MRRFSLVLACGICLVPALISPAWAQWFAKKTPAQPSTNPAAQPGFAGYIRRLMADARAAAARGDLALARSLAERAHKVAVTGKSLLANEPDCSPMATAALVQELKSVRDPASPPVAVVQAAPQSPIDLAPLLGSDTPEATMPVPPSPAPFIETSPRRMEASARTAAERPQHTAAKSAATPGHPTAISSSRITSVLNAPGQRAARSSRSENAAGFLALQTDWLSPNSPADAVIEELADRPAAAMPKKRRNKASDSSSSSSLLSSTRTRTTPTAPRRSVSSDDEFEEPATSAEDAVEPEVTTAIGNGVNRWQLDVEHDAADVNEESAPQLSQDLTARQESSDAASPTTALGVWSTSDAVGGAAAGMQVISLSDFLDPNGNRVSTRRNEEAPRMIETDFRQSVTTAMAADGRPAGSDSPSLQDFKTTSSYPAIQVYDEPALEWLDSAASAGKESPAHARPASVKLDWSRWTPARKAAVMGLALLIAGFGLFSLSFRWT